MTQAHKFHTLTTESCPLVLRYPVSGSLESVRLSSDGRERLIVEGNLHGARVDPRPAYSRIDLLCCSVSLHLKGTWETQNHQAFCVSLVLVIHTNLQSCMSIISETLSQVQIHIRYWLPLRCYPPACLAVTVTKGPRSWRL